MPSGSRTNSRPGPVLRTADTDSVPPISALALCRQRHRLGDCSQIDPKDEGEGIPVAEETLQPTPHGWLEKAQFVGLFVGLAVAAAATIAVFLEQLGFWSYLTIAVGTNIVLQLALPLLIAPLRTKREALDAELGIVECGIRCKSLPPGPPPPATSYQGGWLIGYAKKENESLIFQPRTVFTGSVVGSPLTFENVTPLTGGLRTPVAAPWYLGPFGRGRTVVFLKTDRGVIEVSGSRHWPEGCWRLPYGNCVGQTLRTHRNVRLMSGSCQSFTSNPEDSWAKAEQESELGQACGTRCPLNRDRLG